MEFKNEDLLSSDELFNLFTAESPNIKAKIISQKIKKYVFIDQSERMFFLQENITYRIVRQSSEDELFNIITDYVSKSKNVMDEKTKNKMLEMFEKKKDYQAWIKSNLSNNNVKSFEPQLKVALKNNKIIMDAYTWQLHFENGYLDLKTNKFHKRVLEKDYVTYCIERNYVNSTKEQRVNILEHIQKIYTNKKDLECVLSFIARCLTGTPEIDQDTLFLLGNGSSGKSFVLTLLSHAIGSYVELLQSDTFENNNTKRDKILNEFATKTYALIAWVNEFSDKKVNDSDFKNFCDGKVKTTRLYVDGSHTVTLKCKLIATTNIMPNIQINTGSKRRFLAYTHTSLFTDSDNDVNISQNIFLKDKNLMEKIKDTDNLLNAWVDILAEKCVLNYNNKAPKLTDNFKDTTSSVVSTNDIIQDFIDSTLVITDNADDRIGKNEMKDEFQLKYPDKHLSVQQLLSSLKEKNIEYNAKFRCNNVQGCYVGVKLRTSSDKALDDEAFDKGVEKTEQSVNVNLFLLDENRKLKNKLEELQKMIEALQPKPKAEPKVEPTVEKCLFEKKPTKKTKLITETDEIFHLFN